MYVYYDPETLLPSHTITVHDEHYDPRTNGEHHLRLDEAIPHHEIHLSRDDGGLVTASRKRRMDLAVMHASDGQATIRAVPEGATIQVNGELLGVMDASGCLDLSLETTGFFKVRIECAGYLAEEFELEVDSLD